MLPKFTTPFKVEEDHGVEEGKNGSSISGFRKGTTDSTSTVVVGLRILVQISQEKSNIVVKSSAASSLLPGYKATEYSCYLKSCHLCNKKLSMDKDVYMYRGDQGFCSIECRDRQMYLDDTKELEKSTKQMMALYRHCSSNDRRETQILLKEMRRQRHKQMPRKIQWAIVS